MLEHLFGSKTRVKLLQVFFRESERPFYLRELARLTSTQLNAVRREIANLELLNIIQPVRRPGPADIGKERSKYYQLNPESLLAEELRALLAKAQLVEEQALINQLKNRAGDLSLLLLTGIFTGAYDAPTDLFIVGAVKPLVVARLIHDYELEAGKTVRYTTFSEKEFRERREIGDKFLYSVFESKHLAVINRYATSV